MSTRIVLIAAAIGLFASQGIEVATAEPIKVKDKEDPSKVRDAFKTDTVKLAEAHVLAAKQAPDGTVTITTIDGKKYSAKSKRLLPLAEAEPLAEADDKAGKK
jgi:hypothetical protein